MRQNRRWSSKETYDLHCHLSLYLSFILYPFIPWSFASEEMNTNWLIDWLNDLLLLFLLFIFCLFVFCFCFTNHWVISEPCTCLRWSLIVQISHQKQPQSNRWDFKSKSKAKQSKAKQSNININMNNKEKNQTGRRKEREWRRG